MLPTIQAAIEKSLESRSTTQETIPYGEDLSEMSGSMPGSPPRKRSRGDDDGISLATTGSFFGDKDLCLSSKTGSATKSYTKSAGSIRKSHNMGSNHDNNQAQ